MTAPGTVRELQRRAVEDELRRTRRRLRKARIRVFLSRFRRNLR